MPSLGAPKTSMFVAGVAALKGPYVEKLASWLFSSVPATRRMYCSGEVSSVPEFPEPFTTRSLARAGIALSPGKPKNCLRCWAEERLYSG
jgi:hypothetical protein